MIAAESAPFRSAIALQNQPLAGAKVAAPAEIRSVGKCIQIARRSRSAKMRPVPDAIAVQNILSAGAELASLAEPGHGR